MVVVLFPMGFLAIPLAIATLLYLPYAAVKHRRNHPVLFALLCGAVAWIASGSVLIALIVLGLGNSFAQSDLRWRSERARRHPFPG